jgi:hypothetical protein
MLLRAQFLGPTDPKIQHFKYYILANLEVDMPFFLLNTTKGQKFQVGIFYV